VKALSIDAAAKYLCTTPARIRRLIAAGALPKVYAYGGEPHVTEAALDALLVADDPAEQAPPEPRRIWIVYFIQALPGGNIKIGTTADLEARFRNIQADSPVKLTILATMPGARAVERRLHTRFAHLREHGEWFRPGEDLTAFVQGLPQGRGQSAGTDSGALDGRTGNT
jgi:hypothetical protein